MSRHFDLTDQVVLISGGSRGLGRAVVYAMVGCGAQVAFLYRSDREAAASLVQTAAEQGSRPLAIQVDVADPAGVRDALSEIRKRFGRLDVCVNNAAVTRDALVLQLPPDDWDTVMETNLRGAYLVSREALRVMVPRRQGHIIQIASSVAVRGVAGQAAYAASKAGLIAFGRTLAREAGRYGIRANTVCPGFMETDMTAALTEAARAAALEESLLGRFTRVDEVVNFLLFLCSGLCHTVSGQTFHVDSRIM